MKSRISFFNKTVFLKNVTLFWPIWAVYTLVLLILQPVILWFNYNDSYRFHPLSVEQKTECLIDTMSVQTYVWIISIMAIITGMAVFYYLYNGKSANMIHSLPVDRTQLFGTNVITGYTFLMIPQILTFLVTMFLCLANGVTKIEYLAIWLLILMGIDIIVFSMVTFCAFFTGQFFALPVYAIVLNGLSYWIYSIVNYFVSSFAYGVEYGSLMDGDLLEWFSPFVMIYNNLDVGVRYEDGVFYGIAVSGVVCLIVYLIVAAGLLVAAYLVYQKRQIEQAGDLITVSWVRPIFRWGVGTTGAFFGSLVLKYIFENIGRSFSIPVYVIVLLICGIICYFVADMFVKKSFKVFYKKNWIKCGIFSGVLLVSFGGLCAYSSYCQTYIPSTDRIVSASVSNYYTCEFEGDEIEKVLSIHERILDNMDDIEVTIETPEYESISIRYEMKSGNHITRRYRIALGGIGSEIRRDIYEMEMDADNFLRYRICKHYHEVNEFIAGELNYSISEEYADRDESQEEYYDGRYSYEKLTPEQCEILYKAVIADANAGKLQLYNGVYYYDYIDSDAKDVVDKVSYYADLRFTYVLPKSERKTTEDKPVVYGDSFVKGETNYIGSNTSKHDECYFSFGPDCTNIINALIECGVIESEEQIRWHY